MLHKRMKTLVFAAWLPLARVQIERQEVAAAAAGGKIYVIGGIAANAASTSPRR